ncbi:unnamed protein product [Pedinophyceae sp. YPF-701]|nr:unnamed protein product [Pedinophyceae sp. YPF-701]
MLQATASGGRNVPKDYTMTAGVDVQVLPVPLQSAGMQVELYVHDTCGQEVYGDLVSKFYGGKMAALILAFDLTSEESFRQCQELLHVGRSQMRSRGAGAIAVLVGCKADIGLRPVSNEEISQWAADQGLAYMEVSSLGTSQGAENYSAPFKYVAEAFESAYKNGLAKLEAAAKAS